ncbi:hypothetical protein ACGFSD_32030 [Streptomyces caniferus]|uniref:hypothetical protein n=1 Tax=Streptomyces caniferus TaxID=285557 RepID=UPI0037162635
MWIGAGLIAIALFVAPAVPWFLFLPHRVWGAVDSGVFAAVVAVSAWPLEGARTDICFTVLSALARIVVEAIGLFEPGRAHYRRSRH